MTENDDQNHFSPTILIITIAVEVEVVTISVVMNTSSLSLEIGSAIHSRTRTGEDFALGQIV